LTDDKKVLPFVKRAGFFCGMQTVFAGYFVLAVRDAKHILIKLVRRCLFPDRDSAFELERLLKGVLERLSLPGICYKRF